MSYDNLRQQFEKERIHVVEIDVPRCVNTHGTAPCTATETGDDKCYNTRATCNDLANYNDLISTGSATISVNATNKTFTRSAGSYVTDGFEAGQIITCSGFTNDGNNSQFEIDSVTATVITVTTNVGLVTETGGGDEVITTPNIYTYKHCTARSPHPQNMNNYAPCVKSVSVAPATVDPRGGIGARTSASISMVDFPSSDRYDIDPYLSDRTYDPLDVGLYWLKWRTRNANYENYTVRILTGYIEDNEFDATNFQTRYYVMNSMNAGRGEANITLKDPLQLVSNKKALAPRPSGGSLLSAITSSATSATLDPSGVGDDEYPTSGYVKIRDEVCSFTRTGDSLTLTRAQKNTAADAHDAGDTVQLCLEYTGDSLDVVQADLCITYAGIPAIYIPKGAWEAEVDTYLSSNPDTLITDPTPVDKLIGELCEQWPHKLFWNDRERIIEMVALKAPPSSATTLTGDDNIMELSNRDRTDMQISTVFVHYGQYDPTKKLDEQDNYQVTYGRVNQDAITRYDSNNTKTIFSRWITSANGAGARQLAALHGRRFGITPREISFKLEDKDSNVWVGDVRSINHFDIVDQNGNSVDTVFEITSASEGEVYDYRALEFNYDEALTGDEGGVGVDVVDLSVDEQNVNMRTKYDTLFGTPDSSTVAKFIVYSGVEIGSSSTGSPSIQTGSWPAGATITLQINSGGFVVGKGGAGSSSSSTAGSAGGDALSLGYDLELVNNGVLGGGGGGGGASSADGHTAAGGGGAGDDGGAAGSNDATGTGPVVNNSAPGSGTTENGGAAGSILYGSIEEPSAVAGGAGGDLGQAGTAGDSAGGAAGKAADLNGNTLTQTVSGDIRGTVS